MQHGHSSGLDLRVAMQGGCLFIQGDQLQTRSLPPFKLYLINTGTPESLTGECVEKAAVFFKESSLAEDFAATTLAMDGALQQGSLVEMNNCIRENQRLLTKIGVVPESVQEFIQVIEQHQGSAKICGAGAIKGDSAGVILALTDDPELLSTLCKRYNYEILSIVAEARGVHVI